MQPANRSQIAPVGAGSRMTLANVTKGKQERPLRVCIAGTEGVGKSTFGANAPKPIFLCAEDGTAHLDVARFPTPLTWTDAIEAVRELLRAEHDFKTLVIDSVDWLEPLCWRHVAQAGGKSNIEDFGFGKGYVLAVEQWRDLLRNLDLLGRNRRMHVVLVAHSAIKRVDDPQTGPFDRYQMKLHEKSAAVLREWVDALLFARHEVRTVERNGKTRGMSSGARLLHTTWTAAYDAKNRFDLPETLPLSWEDFEAAVRAHAPADPAKLKAELAELIPQLDADTRAKAEDHLGKCGEDAARLAQLLDRVRSKVALSAGPGGES